ncbi:MAG TPA: RHS repeat-associated core domain-containing protein, partial [Terriglobales bacterium]|nr:RHS repeat-associated core domain-containing protein [Terriglobales bacterium]
MTANLEESRRHRLSQLDHLLPHNSPGDDVRFVFHGIAQRHSVALEVVGPHLAGGNEARSGGDLGQVYTPEGEGRVGSAGGFTPSITYNAASQPTVLQTSCQNGTCYPITYTYDPNTLRMTNYSAAITGGTISGAMNWNPNGSLQSLTIADPFNAADNQTCTYSADDLGRLAGVNCGSTWAQNFSFDPFGNLTKSGSISWQPGYDASTNHYTLGGTSYDADGNLLNDTFNTYTWDVDGKNLSTYYSSSGQTFSFINDAFGHHVEMSNGSYAFSYLALGKFKLSPTGQTPSYSEYPLPGGSVLSQGGGATGVQLADWLGTIRAEYSYTGGSYQFSSAHAPFGETYSSTAGYPEGFAGNGGIGWGQSGDGVMGNTTYWFPERFLRSSQGRWLTPDPAGMDAADLGNPQTWNRYAYVMNNPLSWLDPLGLAKCPPNDPYCEDVTAPPPDDYSMIFDDARTPGFQHFFRRLECANKFANNHSLAAAFGAQNTFLG